MLHSDVLNSGGCGEGSGSTVWRGASCASEREEVASCSGYFKASVGNQRRGRRMGRDVEDGLLGGHSSNCSVQRTRVFPQ